MKRFIAPSWVVNKDLRPLSHRKVLFKSRFQNDCKKNFRERNNALSQSAIDVKLCRHKIIASNFLLCSRCILLRILAKIK